MYHNNCKMYDLKVNNNHNVKL